EAGRAHQGGGGRPGEAGPRHQGVPRPQAARGLGTRATHQPRAPARGWANPSPALGAGRLSAGGVMSARRVAGPALTLRVLALALRPCAAHGDGGAVRLAQQAGPYRVTVFTAPTPLRAGPVDVSVFVQDGAGAALPDVTVRVTLTRGGETLEARATHEAAT